MTFTKHSGATTRWPPQPGSSAAGPVRATWSRDWTTQRPPYKTTLDFQYSASQTTQWVDTLPLDHGGQFYPATPIFTPDTGAVVNLCREKLESKNFDVSEWANNLLEARESLDSVVKRARQLLSFASKLSRGNFPGAASALGLSWRNLDRSRIQKAKSFGDAWLEYHFGWVPAVQDIGSAVKTMAEADFGSKSISARARLPYSFFTPSYHPTDPQGGRVYGEYSGEGHTFSNMGLKVRISNPNSYLANQLGFANPLAVLWEAVPYSFVVDWFSNVGSVLSSMTGFVGLDVVDSYTVQGYEGVARNKNFDWYYGPKVGESHHIPYYQLTSGHSFYVRRSPGIPPLTWRLKSFEGFSPARGATAISLLLQKL